MSKYYVIGWRPSGQTPFFFRGDHRYSIYLPFTRENKPWKGWVGDIEFAKVFEAYPTFEQNSVSKHLDVSRLKVYPYEGELLPTQIFRPTKRPRY